MYQQCEFTVTTNSHIMVSSPALPSLSDILWVYLQNVIAIDHQSFGIIIRKSLVLVLSGI